MLTRTQNKKGLFKIASFSITRNYGGKLKYAVIGNITSHSIFDNTKVLGLYKTESNAMQELDKIHKYLESASDTTVYQIN